MCIVCDNRLYRGYLIVLFVIALVVHCTAEITDWLPQGLSYPWTPALDNAQGGAKVPSLDPVVLPETCRFLHRRAATRQAGLKKPSVHWIVLDPEEDKQEIIILTVARQEARGAHAEIKHRSDSPNSPA